MLQRLDDRAERQGRQRADGCHCGNAQCGGYVTGTEAIVSGCSSSEYHPTCVLCQYLSIYLCIGSHCWDITQDFAEFHTDQARSYSPEMSVL